MVCANDEGSRDPLTCGASFSVLGYPALPSVRKPPLELWTKQLETTGRNPSTCSKKEIP